MSGILPEPFLLPSSFFIPGSLISQHVEVNGVKGRIVPNGDTAKLDENFILIGVTGNFSGRGTSLITKSGNPVGLCHDYWLNIELEYQGRGLALELLCEQIIYNMKSFMAIGGLQGMALNPASTIVCQKAHKVLLERGAIRHE